MNILQTIEAEEKARLIDHPRDPRLPARRHPARQRQDQGRRARARPGLRRRLHRPRRRRHQREFHRPQDQLRRGRRARLPDRVADDRVHRSQASRRRAARQALLPARSSRQVGPDRREADRASGQGVMVPETGTAEKPAESRADPLCITRFDQGPGGIRRGLFHGRVVGPLVRVTAGPRRPSAVPGCASGRASDRGRPSPSHRRGGWCRGSTRRRRSLRAPSRTWP